ncbi:AAA family ATPase [Periweissella fabalis]|uniref:AAA family ATPase n=1 Tax=Periweissella fabalis TaxID=1070421 RepID=A0A7X6S3C5_9LACO|nr:AAA family ATPase [Periweissella fabalis]MCM0598303.1 AAA family ATPase [Periweissella fabalis]NKZ24935.1 AAA family ATPase [Periweissella fabalis]
MENNKTKVSLTAGEPGAGKSYTLIQQAYQALISGKSVYIMTPTHSAKANLITTIDKQVDEFKDSVSAQHYDDLKSTIHVLYGYKGQQEVFIDEIGMINITTLFGLFYQTERIENVHVHLFGDIKQLPAIKGNSVIEQLLRNNLKTSLWQFANDKCYDNFMFKELLAPDMWHLDKPVDVTILNHNHRLNELGYTSYNNDFFTDVINKTIEIATPEEQEFNPDFNSATLYLGHLLKAVKDYSLILTPTHKRGDEINSALKANNNETLAPFIINNKKTYLNPVHKDYELLKLKFGFIPEIEDADLFAQGWTHGKVDKDQYEFSFCTTVHKAQGATVSSVVFYMGNEPIANGHKEHYSNNMLYTSVTRASDEIKLLGKLNSFELMHTIYPKSAQTRCGHYRADGAVKLLFKRLREIDETLGVDDIYSLYQDVFNTIELSEEQETELLNYSVKSNIYTKEQLIRKFKDYKINTYGVFAKNDYKYLVYDKFIDRINAKKQAKGGANSKGKGKVQTFINSLSDEQLKAVKTDVESLSMVKFKAKYNMDRRAVTKAIA